MSDNRFKWKVSPEALLENQVKVQNARFTVLTSSLIRMEFSDENFFEDREVKLLFIVISLR